LSKKNNIEQLSVFPNNLCQVKQLEKGKADKFFVATFAHRFAVIFLMVIHVYTLYLPLSSGSALVPQESSSLSAAFAL
jgi:hypothetical protein